MFLFHLNIIARPANEKQANLHCSSLFDTKYGPIIMCMLSCLSCLTLWPHGLAGQAPLSMEFSRQEYWNGLPFPSSANLPDPGLLDCRQILYYLSHWEKLIAIWLSLGKWNISVKIMAKLFKGDWLNGKESFLSLSICSLFFLQCGYDDWNSSVGFMDNWGDLKNGRCDLGAEIQEPGFWLTSRLPWISHGLPISRLL